MRAVHSWFRANHDMISNAASLVGTTAVTSGLGFVYWWAAARLFPAAEVGFASAAVSAMMLLGVVGVVGLGTLLISELPRLPPREAGALLSASLLLALGVSFVLGWAFALGAPSLAPGFGPLARSLWGELLFALGVSVTAVTLVLDLALIGLLRGGLQLWRNASFAVVKLLLLLLVGLQPGGGGLAIYATWLAGNALSLCLLAFLTAKRGHAFLSWPKWTRLGGLTQDALKHHGLNLATQAPGFIFPVLVVVLLSAEANASFYAAWMIVSFVHMVPTHLSTVLHAVGTQSPAALAQKLGFSLRLSLLISALASVTLLIVAPIMLHLFGPDYTQAQGCLRLLALGALPTIVKAHYVTLSRLRGFIGSAALYAAAGGLLELSFAAAGALLGGLAGLGAGITLALVFEAIFMAPPVYRALRPRTAQASQQLASTP